jgi:hypothetical protein
VEESLKDEQTCDGMSLYPNSSVHPPVLQLPYCAFVRLTRAWNRAGPDAHICFKTVSSLHSSDASAIRMEGIIVSTRRSIHDTEGMLFGLFKDL